MEGMSQNNMCGEKTPYTSMHNISGVVKLIMIKHFIYEIHVIDVRKIALRYSYVSSKMCNRME